MSEHSTQLTGPELDEEDVEGHRVVAIDGPDEDDVEGHIQPPRGDDTDHGHSVRL